MTGIDWMVLLAGTALIVWINWYFFFSGGQTATAAAVSSGVQEVTITVRGGYDPSQVRARPGQPLRLIFDRQETSGCSEEIVVPDFGIRRFLPPMEKTAVELLPTQPGVFEFTCGMSMLRGTIIVEE